MKKKVRVNLVQAISNDQGGWDVLMLKMKKNVRVNLVQLKVMIREAGMCSC